MAITNEQGKLILVNGGTHRVKFDVSGSSVATFGTDLDDSIVTSALQVYLAFNNNLLDTNVNNVGGHNASVVSGVPTFAGGPNSVGASIVFDGSTRIDVDNSNTGTTNIRPPATSSTGMSIDFWVKLASHSGNVEELFNLSTFANGLGITLDADSASSYVSNEIEISYSYDSAATTRSGILSGSGSIPSFSLIAWNHICITVSTGSVVKLFVNKILAYNNTFGGSNISYSGASNEIGRYVGGTNKFTTGNLSSWKIYNKALSDGGVSSIGSTATGEVAQNYAAGGGI